MSSTFKGRLICRELDEESHYCSSPIHLLMSEAAMVRRLGLWGLSVPAVTLIPSASIACANFLASRSVGNAVVFLGYGAREVVGCHALGP